MNRQKWRIWIDTGGTFTDCIAHSPVGEVRQLKVLSTGLLMGRVREALNEHELIIDMQWPAEDRALVGMKLEFANRRMTTAVASVDAQRSLIRLRHPVVRALKNLKGTVVAFSSGEDVPVFACRLLTGTPPMHDFPAMQLKLGSTRGTNALLERNGARTALLVTKGFGDLLIIGDQQRPHLFSLNVSKPKPLYQTVIEVNERIDRQGGVLQTLGDGEIRRILARLRNARIESVAVALMNSYKNADHEVEIGKALTLAGFRYVSLSHRLASHIGILARARTTLVNGYLAPIMERYVSGIAEALNETDVQFMSSAGGMLDAARFNPKDSLLSGPAGGVIGAFVTGQRTRNKSIISFDMGGTSTDVSLCSERPDYRFECTVGEHSILSPALAIESIAAGGGSICALSGNKLMVGPRSAGANPGPACYGGGGPLTVTDVNLLLGRLDPRNFSIPIQEHRSRAAFESLLRLMKSKSRTAYKPDAVLASFVQIANEMMAEAIRKVSVHRGIDPVDFAMICFGGAGGQHACGIATLLGIKKIIIPYEAGLLSAIGIGNAMPERIREKVVLSPLHDTIRALDDHFGKLFDKARKDLVKEGHRGKDVVLLERVLFMRMKGQETAIEVQFRSRQTVLQDFKRVYRKVYGHWIEKREIEVETVRIRAGIEDKRGFQQQRSVRKFCALPRNYKRVFLGRWRRVPVHIWEDLKPGASFRGPALLLSGNSTTLIEEGWDLMLDASRTASLMHTSTRPTKDVQVREAELELYTNRFGAIAGQMGSLLRRTAFSVNVKERRDFSCALLDSRGRLIVNAPHIPVHLGSMGVCVRRVKTQLRIEEGDVVITNHPAFGGSHLPDVTLICPVFHKKALIGFVANRAHHAEMGGKQPGSMPADARSLVEEGVVIRPAFLVKRGKAQWDAIRALFTGARYPTRSPEENLADLQAALASVNLGVHLLKDLCDRFGASRVKRFMDRIEQHAARLMKEYLDRLHRRNYHARERLDDGSILEVSLQLRGGKLMVDFTGSAQQHPGNLNATRAVVQSVVLYVLRLMVQKELPLNEGLLRPVRLIVPHGILSPRFAEDDTNSPAVVGGNTELSQRLTDTLLKSLSLAGCSQGTMNNVLFGDASFGYYETLAGGVGAGKGFDGADAVHQHMTNTRVTDPEILEWRYPVRLIRFALRRRSGGAGRWHGGNGIIREILFERELEVNVLSQHRVEEPYGLKGGRPGKRGEQYLMREDGRRQKLKGIDLARVSRNDRLVVLTPGGGGYGPPS